MQQLLTKQQREIMLSTACSVMGDGSVSSQTVE
jgi:hypothetical protein